MDIKLKRALAPSLSRGVTLVFAIASGLAVSTIYSAQPVLDSLAEEFGIGQSVVGSVITITQICYALGLLFLVPLGDLFNPRRLIAGMMLLSAVALLVVGTAVVPTLFYIGLAIVGGLAVVTQALVAYASSLASPQDRGKVVGTVTSGIVIGILSARTFAGTLTDLYGWRSVYLVYAALMLLFSGMLYRILPARQTVKQSLPYLELIRSVFRLFAEENVLRVRAILGMLIFTAFSTLWTSMVLPLRMPPHSLSHTVIGALGLAGVAGALAAVRSGRLADRGYGQATSGIALLLLTVSWLPIRYGLDSLPLLLVGILLLDAAVQAVHVTNQSLIFRVRPEARSRLTAGYMIFYSIGSATGSIASTQLYSVAGWTGVCLFGATVSALALLFWGLTLRVGKDLSNK